jgi:hypothetical protein
MLGKAAARSKNRPLSVSLLARSIALWFALLSAVEGPRRAPPVFIAPPPEPIPSLLPVILPPPPPPPPLPVVVGLPCLDES